MKYLSELEIKIFADGADLKLIKLYQNFIFGGSKSGIQGFTTNPSILRKAGIGDYEAFCRMFLDIEKERPISFEVIADDYNEMLKQAIKLASLGDNVYVKIPVTNTRGGESYNLIKRLSDLDIKVNVTAVMTLSQVEQSCWALDGGPKACISVFAGRIADTGRDPIPHMKAALSIMKEYPNIELIWASPRELLNIFQADEIGCHIITATSDILKKLPLVGKSLPEYSLETVKMFYEDAKSSGFTLGE